MMNFSDAVVGHFTTLYLLVIAVMKAYGLATGKSYSGCCVLLSSTLVVMVILLLSLAWDVSTKVAHAVVAARGDHEHHHHGHEMCRGGICWHGVAVKSPASQVRFRLPQHNN